MEHSDVIGSDGPTRQRRGITLPAVDASEKPVITPYRIAFAALWVLITTALGIMLYFGFRGRSEGVGRVLMLGIVFTAALVWYLFRTGPSVSAHPTLEPLAFPGRTFGRRLWRLTLVLLVGPILISAALVLPWRLIGGWDLVDNVYRYLRPWIVLEGLLALVALRIVVMWRRRLTPRLVAVGITVGLLAGAAQAVQIASSGDPFDVFWAVFQTVAVPPLFIGGGLLLEHTGIGRSRLLKGEYGGALVSFLAGCVLYLPLALVNTVGGAPAGYTWMDALWKPLAFCWLPALAEEAWARLFLVTLCYALLRPVSNEHPRRAVVAAVLLSATAHGLVHGPSLTALLETGLIYLLPMAVLFVKRDWEHAVGAHYVVNLVPFLAVFFGL
jgi:hypothetical protein